MISYQTSQEKPKPKNCGHTKPQAPIIELDQPGRLRVAHVMAILSISHSLLYQGMKEGRYPKPDGWDGKFPYWNTGTISAFLEA